MFPAGSRNLNILVKMNQQKKAKYLKIATTVGIVTVFIFMIGGVNNSSSPDSQQSVDSTQSNNAEDTGEDPTHIPDLVAVDVYGNLEDEGLTCDGPNTNADSEFITWNCELETSTYNYTAEIVGRETDEIVSVQATALNYGQGSTDSLAQDFLSYVASIPYDGSSPAEASNWVRENISRNTVTSFGSVGFEIFANSPNARILNISLE